MSTEPNKVIYSMVGVSKYYDKKAVLKDIYLSYFYGAKIGVIGLNGSGKSSLLRILAGVASGASASGSDITIITISPKAQELRVGHGNTVKSWDWRLSYFPIARSSSSA